MKHEAHTPGPWSNGVSHIIKVSRSEIGNNGRYSCLIKSGIIAEVFGDTKEECEANARLIAAAPELLEALELIVKNVRAGITGNNEINSIYLRQAEKAIQKATHP